MSSVRGVILTVDQLVVFTKFVPAWGVIPCHMDNPEKYQFVPRTESYSFSFMKSTSTSQFVPCTGELFHAYRNFDYNRSICPSCGGVIPDINNLEDKPNSLSPAQGVILICKRLIVFRKQFVSRTGSYSICISPKLIFTKFVPCAK